MSESQIFPKDYSSSLKFPERTLFVHFNSCHIENFRQARIRNLISDKKGALIYVNEAIRQNKYIKEYYLLKMEIFLKTDCYQYAIVNFLKADFLEGKKASLINNDSKNELTKHFIRLEKTSRDNFMVFFKYYEKRLRELKTIDDHAIDFTKSKLFYLDSLEIEKRFEYDLFLDLKESLILKLS